MNSVAVKHISQVDFTVSVEVKIRIDEDETDDFLALMRTAYSANTEKLNAATREGNSARVAKAMRMECILGGIILGLEGGQ